jgi:ribosome-associated toxin RatA of RatAB toxin-antitoxin module
VRLVNPSAALPGGRRRDPPRVRRVAYPPAMPPDGIDAQARPGTVARRVFLAALAWLGLAAGPAAAATIAVEVSRQADAIRIEASALLRTDIATAWRVLTDYERYVEFIPDLRTSRVVARHDRMVTVQQSGDAALWFLRIPLDITFEIVEFPPSRLRSRAVAGSLRALESTYLLTQETSGVRLDYVGRVATGFELFGPIEQFAVERNIARQFQALADAIEQRRIAGAGETPAAAGSP